MKFGVIYTVDCKRSVPIGQYLPPNKRPFQQTENDRCGDYDHLGGGWRGHRHRKFVGILTKAQFESLLKKTGLCASSTETLGSLGVPWTDSGMGVAPAIAFEVSDNHSILSAYVTPLPEYGQLTERNWERIRTVVLGRYRNGI